MNQRRPSYLPSLATSDPLAILSRCGGYIELRMLAEALEEIASLPPSLRQDLRVLVCEMEIVVALKDRQRVFLVGLKLADTFPDDLDVLLMAARYLLTIEDYASARIILRRSLTRFAGRPAIWRQLAAVEACLGNMEEAESCAYRSVVLSRHSE